MNADVPYDERHPIIEPPKHHLTKILIIDEHENLLHAGSQFLLAMLRRRFWIPNGRNTVKGVIRKCLKCFRLKSKTAVQLMGQLPAARVNQSHPFQHCGVDYAGPIAVKHGGRRSKVTTKAYIDLFICIATKAIHLELVSDLVTSSFLAALRKFIATRGKPSHMCSDNGTTFVGADNELKRFLSNDATVEGVVNFSTSEGISWRFTPPPAPHFGGLWEAGIKCMKSHLTRVIGNAVLTFEELTTVLIQIEACLNSRPLCLLSDDLDSPAALTPGHFLIGQPLCAHPEPSVLEVPANRLHRWQLVQQLHQSFWKRWSTEYIHDLQQHKKWTSEGAWQHQIGNPVLVKEDNLPPLVWRLGVIDQLFPGPDKCVRVVMVKTASGQIKRPIAKLCPLPKQ
ncbi:uncharacterized protein LOC124594161 [Schistocerca americana]|uniref:uncharacterized protein LOC124594161 n=1 Tax=Schistocerca americana TaxID=7009 RepID=UPI001F4FD2B9|nr:uncharacterized protein LOC124594161 [Schistocerca americana]